MLLAVDIGNTNIVFGLFEGCSLQKTWRCETRDFLRKKNPGFDQAHHITGVIVSSVVPKANDIFQKYCRDELGLEALFVTAAHVDLKIDLGNPGEIGADRLVNAVAALAYYKAPVIVVDFGTATTFDVIDQSGTYCGGCIAPGVNLSIASLHEATAQLPKITLKNPQRSYGKNTVEAMQAGLYWGYIGLIEGIVARISADMDSQPFILATGGLAPLFADTTSVIDHVDETLTLKGLCHIDRTLKAKGQDN